MKDWDLSFGFYPGILIGFRTYNEVEKNQPRAIHTFDRHLPHCIQ
jgi:hypothetical protein